MRLPVLGSMMRLRSELSGLTESRWTLHELEQLAYLGSHNGGSQAQPRTRHAPSSDSICSVPDVNLYGS